MFQIYNSNHYQPVTVLRQKKQKEELMLLACSAA
jgi:uncharacterized protein (DUF1330 family)